MQVTVVLLAAIVLGACGVRESPVPSRPDIILVSLDTFRADLLEGTDARGVIAPSIRILARESVWYRRAFSPMAFTLPAHMTVMTSLHPESHGVTTQKSTLSPSVPTLAQVLHDQGYFTAGIVGSSWLKSGFGFDRGFDVYHELEPALSYAPRVRAFAQEILQSRPDKDQPLFLFLHFFDAHSDFGFDDNRLTYFSPPNYRSHLEIPDEALCDARGRCATDWLRFADRENRVVRDQLVDAQHDLYRAGARFLDNQISRLLEQLRSSGEWDRALTIVFADHGEEFREHGRFLHSQVYRESLHVPILFHLPDRSSAGTVDDRHVGLVDLPATILAYAGITTPPMWQGRDLLDADHSPPPGPAVEVAQDKLSRHRYALRTIQDLFVLDLESGQANLFAVTLDSGEIHPLQLAPDLARAWTQRLLEAIRQLRRSRPNQDETQREVLTDEEKRVLHSLGYL